jgi:hypothetical protein
MNTCFFTSILQQKGFKGSSQVVKNETVVQEIRTHVPDPVASNNDETGRVASSLFYMIAVCQVVPVNHEPFHPEVVTNVT